MLQNASLLAIVAVDTAENEPSEVGCQMRRRRWGPVARGRGAADPRKLLRWAGSGHADRKELVHERRAKTPQKKVQA